MKRLYGLVLSGLIFSGFAMPIVAAEGAAINPTVEELAQVKKAQEASKAVRSGIMLGVLTGFSSAVTDSLLRDPLATLFTWFAAQAARDSYIENNFENNINARRAGYSAGSLTSWTMYAITLCIMRYLSEIKPVRN